MARRRPGGRAAAARSAAAPASRALPRSPRTACRCAARPCSVHRCRRTGRRRPAPCSRRMLSARSCARAASTEAEVAQCRIQADAAEGGADRLAQEFATFHVGDLQSLPLFLHGVFGRIGDQVQRLLHPVAAAVVVGHVVEVARAGSGASRGDICPDMNSGVVAVEQRAGIRGQRRVAAEVDADVVWPDSADCRCSTRTPRRRARRWSSAASSRWPAAVPARPGRGRSVRRSAGRRG